MFPQLTGQRPSRTQVNSTGIGGDNKMIGPIATQNLGGNSLTQMMRSMQNYMGTEGANTYGFGQDIIGTGMQGFGTAGDTTGTALDTTRSALGTLSPAESYWSKLLSGDRDTVNEAISPVATRAGLNAANISRQAAANMPRGGYSAILQAQAPQQVARTVNEAVANLQPVAATQLNTIAGTKNNIAGTQGQIAQLQGQLANWLSTLGVDVSKLGQNFIQMMAQSLMEGRGQDVTEHGQSMQLAGDAARTAVGAYSASPWSRKP